MPVSNERRRELRKKYRHVSTKLHLEKDSALIAWLDEFDNKTEVIANALYFAMDLIESQSLDERKFSEIMDALKDAIRKYPEGSEL